MKKMIRKTIALLLILSMIVLLPLQTIAMGVETDLKSASDTTSALNKGNSNIIGELIDKRDANTKHFLRSDGTVTAVQYDSSIHYYEKGKWLDYDNTMVVEDDSLPDHAQEYVNTAGDAKIKFSKKAKANKMMTYCKEDHEISWGYADANKSTVQIVSQEDNRTGDARWTVLTKAATEAVYEDLYQDVDLQVIVSTAGVKENLILQKASAKSDFEIEYKLKNLVAKQIDAQTIGLYHADGTLTYELNAPVMQDATGALSNAVSLTILENKDNKLTLQLTADQEWLQAEERVYPVTVDPSFYQKTSSSNLKAITVYTGTAPAYSKTLLYTSNGNYGGFGTTVSIVKFETLPQLNPGDVVIDAQLTVFRNDMASTSSKVQVYASQVYSLPSRYDAAQYRAAWDDSFSYSSQIEDYEIETGSMNFQQRNFNITKTVKQWYTGVAENNGICLSSYCATTNYYYVRYCLTEYTQYIPCITITYRNAIGLEAYWTYHSQSVANGNSFINDFSGNLVYQLPIFAGSGVKNPASFSLYYNSAVSNVVGTTPIAFGWSSNLGQQIIKLSSSSIPLKNDLINSGYEYAFLDSDSTYHYLKKKSTNVYVDEDGLKLTLQVDSNSTDARYILKFNSGGQNVFNSNGKLVKCTDSLGFDILIAYDATNYPITVTDGAGRVYTLTWTGGKLTKVTEPDGSETTLSYGTDTGTLWQVTYDDGTSTTFFYDTYINGNDTYYRITRVASQDMSYLQYSYRTADLDYDFAERTVCTGVQSVTEYVYGEGDSTFTAGATLSMSYGNDATTTFTYTRGSVSNSEILVFDALGRSTSALYSDGSATDLTYTPTATGQSGSDTNNRISSISSGTKISRNFLSNGELMNNAAGWSSVTVNGISESEMTVSSNGYHGQGFYFSDTALGIYVLKGQKVTGLIPGQTYTFSGYLKYSTAGSAGLYIGYNTDNGMQIQNSAIGQTKNDSEWEHHSITFVAPDAATEVWALFGSTGTTVGTTYYDSFWLEDGQVANPPNMLQNALFDHGTANWTLHNGSAAGSVSSDSFGNYYTFTGNALKNTYLSQEIDVYNVAKAFRASATVSAQSVCIEGEKTFSIKAVVTYSDQTTDTYTKSFNAFSTARQRVTMAFCPNPEKTPQSISYQICFGKNIGSIKIYETMLEADESSVGYAYDTNGNLISATDQSGNEEDYVYYDSTDLLAKSANALGEITYHTYDSTFQYNPTAEWSAQTSLGTFYTYNTNGTLSTTTVGTAKDIVTNDSTKTYSATLDTSKPFIRSSVSYDTTGNYVVAATDARGNTTTSNIDPTNGRLNSVTDAKNNTTSYLYDQNTKLLTGVSSGNSSVQYTYNNKRDLVNVTTGSTVYTFEYDKWGNRTKVKVGNRTLVTTNYIAATSLPSYSIYGSTGPLRLYNYDQYDRLIHYSYGPVSPTMDLAYNNAGLLARTTDSAGMRIGSLITNYFYDLKNRLSQKSNQQMTVRYAYDALDRTTRQTYDFKSDGKRLDYTYSYNQNGAISSFSIENQALQLYHYDSLNRLSTKQFCDWDNGSIAFTYYYYQDGANGSATNLVSKLEFGPESLYYSYDSVGNISQLSMNAAHTLSIYYEYDELGQLVRENDFIRLKTYTYDYDNAGNITTVTEYPFTSSTVDLSQITPNKVTNYVYGDEDWGDLLTGYNGQTFTYDNLGNPLTYRDGMTMSWSYGRRLASVTQNGSSYQYTYNADGLRTSKTVGGVTTDYVWDGTQLLMQQSGTDSPMYFFYDAEGCIGFQYNGNRYYYRKNLQGDVIALMNSAGTILCNYTYDAWGKLLEITDNSNGIITDATHIGFLNPIRYRGYYYDHETGFYYVSSRYYDPEIGRWINADSVIAGVGGDLKGYNLFAYCFNNPVNMDDQAGSWPKWIKNTVKWVAKNIVKPVVKTVQKTLSKVDLTYSTGVNVSGTPSAWIFNGQIGVSMDTKGNVAIQASGGGGITGGDPSISITRYRSVTNAPNIDKLNDAYSQVGGSIAVPIEGVPVAAGGDVMFIPDPELITGYFGLTGNIGLGTPGKEFHVEWGTTVTVPYTQFNVYDVARSVYIKIMEW